MPRDNQGPSLPLSEQEADECGQIAYEAYMTAAKCSPGMAWKNLEEEWKSPWRATAVAIWGRLHDRTS